ncbi:MAG: LptF/LptG family permease [Candidatus Omnitrophica bacterium]|jgi:lipopolysaccharide export system permease protein|nr:LptF/LptG family permease [Candidatus Omnitrophota bacterium]
MRILDKYILKNIVYCYLFILFVFITLYFIIDISYTLSDILKSKPPASVLISYYLNMIPLIFLTVSPFSLPISVFYTFGELGRHNEVLSMRASGISVLRIAFPIIFFSIIVSSGSLFIQEKILIGAQKKIEDIKIHSIKKTYSSQSDETNLAFSSMNTIFFVGKFSPQKKTLSDVIMFEENERKNITKKTIAKSMVYAENKWEANGVMEYKLDSAGNITGMPVYWAKKEIKLEEKPETLVFKKSILFQFASLKNLKKEIRQLKQIKAFDKLANLTIDYNRKIVEPLSTLFLVIGILPLALEIKKRRAGFSSLGVGIICSFVYYTFMYFGIALGKGGIILANFSPWLAPLFFVSAGITGLIFLK